MINTWGGTIHQADAGLLSKISYHEKQDESSYALRKEGEISLMFFLRYISFTEVAHIQFKDKL